MILELMTAVALFEIPKNTNFWFNVYQGQRNGGPYTTETSVGYPRGTNINTFAVTLTNQPSGTNYYVVTANARGFTETDYSTNQATNAGLVVNLTWQWTAPTQYLTNILIVSSGTNSVMLTNPVPNAMFFRLHLTSWTSSELQFTSWPDRGPWAVLTNWVYQSNRTPRLAIMRL